MEVNVHRGHTEQGEEIFQSRVKVKQTKAP